MLNRSILIGRLTRDPEMKYTPAGVAVTQFTLAVDRPTAADREREADFIPIVTWRQLAETCANHLNKGRLVAVEGRIQVRNYENSEGKRVYVTEVIADNVRFLDYKKDDEGGGGAGDQQQSGRSGNSGGNSGASSGRTGGSNSGGNNSGRGNSGNTGGNSGNAGGGGRGGNGGNSGRGGRDPFSDDGRPIDISEDDLPF